MNLALGKIPRRLALALTYSGIYFLGLQGLRLFLSLYFPPPSAAPIGDWIRTFAVGFHFDLVVTVAVFSPWAVWAAYPSQQRWKSIVFRSIFSTVALVFWFLMTFLIIAEGLFFEEFQSRFNTVAIDYLIYPHEVFVNIWETYPVPAILAGVASVAGGVVWLGWTVAQWAEQKAVSQPCRRAAWIWVGLALLGAFTVRPEFARFSRERTLNELSNNGTVSVLTAALTRNLDYTHFYPTLPEAEAHSRTRALLATPDAVYPSSTEALRRHIPGDSNRPPLNLILLLEESLGSEFWGSLGRTQETLMPRMDALVTREGLLFENLYATGNRTIRGYEGVFSSFPPLPGDSIVARDRSEHVETLARVMARQGYDTSFIYAGRGIFDGTGPFTKANGWSNFVELKDFKTPTFKTVWGVCNEDLYDRVLAESRARHQRGRPFFVTSMSVSNHKPYTYPTGRINEDPNAKRRDHVVKYSDYALRRFFDMARKEPFWTNTLIAVVADHGARVYGSQTIPIRSYEIPMWVTGATASLDQRRISTLGCQLDIAPTLLGLTGQPYDTVFFGRDLLKWPELPSRCLLHHNRSIGIYSDQRLVIFSMNNKVEYFSGDPKRGQMQRAMQADARHMELQKDATALFQIADKVYLNRQFRVD